MCQIFRNTPEKGLNLYNCGCYTSSKSGDLDLCPSKTLIFGTFLEKILFLTHFGQIYPPMIYIKGKLCISAFCTYPNNTVFLNQQAVRILQTLGDRNVPMYWDLVVIKVRSVDKNCLHMEICQSNKNCLFWSHLVKNVTKLRQSTILSCSLTLGDKWSRNRLEVSGQKRPALKASQATLTYFSWSHLIKKMTKCRKAMIPWWYSETDWKMVMQQKCSQLTKIAPL